MVPDRKVASLILQVCPSRRALLLVLNYTCANPTVIPNIFCYRLSKGNLILGHSPRVVPDGKGNRHTEAVPCKQSCLYTVLWINKGCTLPFNSYTDSSQYILVDWSYFTLNSILEATHHCWIPPDPAQQYVVMETWINLVIHNFLHMGTWVKCFSRLNKVTSYLFDNNTKAI